MRARFLLLAIVVLGLGTALRLHNITTQSLWHDEGNSLRLAERSIPDLIAATSRDIHPPAYYLILKLWISLIGTTELSLRMLSVFWSILTIGIVIGIGRNLKGYRSGIIAGFLVAIQPFAIYYAQETRMYAQFGAISLLSVWLMLRFLNANQHIWQWALSLAFINTIGLYTHYTYPFIMLAQGLFFLWGWLLHRDNLRLKLFISLNLITIGLFSLWLPTAYQQVTTWPTTGDTTTTLERLSRIFEILFYGNTATEIAPAGYMISIGILLIGLLAIRQQSALLLPLFICVLSVGSLLLSGAYREANLKFLLPAQGATALMLSVGIINLARLRPPISAIVAIASFVILIWPYPTHLKRLYEDAAYQRSDYRTITHIIQMLETDNSVVILNAPNQQEVFSYYFQGKSEVVGLPRGLGGDDAATQRETENLIHTHDRIFLVLWGQAERDPNAIVQSTLDAYAYVVRREWVTDVELIQYAVLEAPPSQPQHPLDVQFGDVLKLQGFSLSAQQFIAGRGDVVGVTLYWQATAPITTRYKISVQLLTPEGFLADQHDSEPSNNLRPTTSFQLEETIIDNHGIIIDQELPSGEYQLHVVVYDANAPTVRLQPNVDTSDASLPLATLTIESEP